MGGQIESHKVLRFNTRLGRIKDHDVVRNGTTSNANAYYCQIISNYFVLVLFVNYVATGWTKFLLLVPIPTPTSILMARINPPNPTRPGQHLSLLRIYGVGRTLEHDVYIIYAYSPAVQMIF